MSTKSVTSTSARHGGASAERREWVLFALLVGPSLLLFAVFTYWPLLYKCYLSFVRWDMLAPVKTWVGLYNYRELFTSPAFIGILVNTLVFTVTSVGLICGLGLLLALLRNQPLHGCNSVSLSTVTLTLSDYCT
jgi:ABC-type sugar transport system permease subunit